LRRLQFFSFERVPLCLKSKALHGLFQTASYLSGMQPHNFLRIHSLYASEKYNDQNKRRVPLRRRRKAANCFFRTGYRFTGILRLRTVCFKRLIPKEYSRRNSYIFTARLLRKKSGSRGMLPSPSPLRTVLAPFNAHGSGISKAIPDGDARLRFVSLCDTHLHSSGGFPQRGAPAD
jgi:hypothetical protein